MRLSRKTYNIILKLAQVIAGFGGVFMCVHPLKTCPMCNSGCIIVASQLRESFFFYPVG